MPQTGVKPDNGRKIDPKDGPLSLPALMAFAFPALPHAFVALPLNIVIPAFYATHTAVTLLQIGVFTSASRLLDAFLDPLVGFLSDRTNTRWGKRKPWTLAAGLVCGASLFFLFQPPSGATILYYGFWSFLLYFGFSLFEIPRMAWSSEISRDYKERSRINTAVAQFNVAGSLVFWVTPILLFKFSGTTSITGTSLTAIAWLYLVLMPAGLILAAIMVPKGAKVATQTLRLRDLFASVRLNRPLQHYLLAYGLWGLGQGAALSSTILFLSDRMRLASAFPFLMIALFGTTIVAMPMWSWLAVRMGRHKVWALSLLLSALSRPLVLLIAPGTGALWPILILTCLSGALTAPWNFAPPAMLSDVIDYDLLKSRTNKAGNIFALNTLLVKASMAIGAGGAFAVLDAFHYHAGKFNAGSGETGLLICYILIPSALHLLSAAAGWGFPLDASRQAIIRRRLESVGARAA
jgi:Na+/melibiose symporter-like transporter